MLVLLIAGGTFYQVDETEQVIVTQFGEPVRGPITTPGLKMKVPFIQTIRRFDKRIWSGMGCRGRSPRWISSLSWWTRRRAGVSPTHCAFCNRWATSARPRRRLDDLINSAARDVVSSHLLIQTVRTFARELPPEELDEGREEQRARAGSLILQYSHSEGRGSRGASGA